MRTEGVPPGVGVGVGVNVGVGVAVGVSVGVGVKVDVGDGDGLVVGDGMSVGVGVCPAVGDGVTPTDEMGVAPVLVGTLTVLVGPGWEGTTGAASFEAASTSKPANTSIAIASAISVNNRRRRLGRDSWRTTAGVFAKVGANASGSSLPGASRMGLSTNRSG